MAYVPMKRTRALVIVHQPQAYAPSRVRDAANYLLVSLASTEEEQRKAKEGLEWLRGKQQAPPKLERKPATEAVRIRVQKKADKR